MTLVIGLLMIVGAAGFVAAPFFGSERVAAFGGRPSGLATDRQSLERQKLDAYAAIKELEFDYRMGKLSDVDYNAIREKYTAQALHAIASIDTLKTTQPRQLADAARREGRRPRRIAFCPGCGHAVPARANFCPGCGYSLKEAVA